jgi:hypothetical protein
MRECGSCGRTVDRQFRFCPWCAAPLRRKLTDFFLGRGGKALRVSRYVADDERHVRFSVWNEEGVAEAVVALEDDEAERLAAFIEQTAPTPTADVEPTPRA